MVICSSVLLHYLFKQLYFFLNFSIEEECAVSWCSNRLEKENMLWKNCLTRFMDSLEKFGAALRSFMTLSDENIEDTVDQMFAELSHLTLASSGTHKFQGLWCYINHLSNIAHPIWSKVRHLCVITRMSLFVSELSNQYSMKVTCEHQLPTATKRLR